MAHIFQDFNNALSHFLALFAVFFPHLMYFVEKLMEIGSWEVCSCENIGYNTTVAEDSVTYQQRRVQASGS